MTKITLEAFATALDRYLCCDLLETMESICSNIMQCKRGVTQEEAREMQKMLSKIYRVSHAAHKTVCSHPDWQEELRTFIKPL